MTTTTQTRTNQYAATCINCRGHVAAGAGTLSRSATGWIVAHVNCNAQPTGWSNAAIARRGGSIPAAHAGNYGSCIDCGNRDELSRGLCWNCR